MWDKTTREKNKTQQNERKLEIKIKEDLHW